LEFLSVKKENYVATVTFNRPPANALASSVLKELDAVLAELEVDRDVRVLIIHGEGKFFSAGADIKEFTTIETAEDFSELAKKGQEVFERIEQYPKPVIAAIHGAALGGGLELAMACHIRFATESAKLGLPELQLGIIPGFAGSQRLTRYVGVAKALEMMLTSEPITGKEAYQAGLVNHVVKEEELLEKAYELAAKIAAKSPLSVKAVIELAYMNKNSSFQEGCEKEANLFGQLFQSADAKEGIQAFIEKRKPNFKGE
jgi:enoyl-CoA hydratase